MTFLNALKNLVGKEDPLATVIWACDPLLIVDEHGAQVFAGKADVEFTPDAAGSSTGTAVVPDTGFQLNVQQRLNEMVSVDVDIRSRGGFTLLGEDAEGAPRTWYIGRAADRFLLNR
jgi:hypothetical protein